jgi:hypothetical protein
MQIAAIEFARNVAGLKGANSTEFDKDTPNPVISLIEEQKKVENLGASMRLGAYSCVLEKGTHSFEAYKSDKISERHRHRYEFNNAYRLEVDAKTFRNDVAGDSRIQAFIKSGKLIAKSTKSQGADNDSGALQKQMAKGVELPKKRGKGYRMEEAIITALNQRTSDGFDNFASALNKSKDLGGDIALYDAVRRKGMKLPQLPRNIETKRNMAIEELLKFAIGLRSKGIRSITFERLGRIKEEYSIFSIEEIERIFSSTRISVSPTMAVRGGEEITESNLKARFLRSIKNYVKTDNKEVIDQYLIFLISLIELQSTQEFEAQELLEMAANYSGIGMEQAENLMRYLMSPDVRAQGVDIGGTFESVVGYLRGNAAMLGNKGGIDLNPANMNLQTKMDSRFRGNDKGIKFHLTPAMLAQLQKAPGFVPVIINIQPMNDLRKFLGLNDSSALKAG